MNIDSATSSVVAKLQALKEQNSKDLEKNANDIKSTGRKSSEEIRQKKQMQQIIEARDFLKKAINGSDADFTYQPPAASSAALTRSDLAALAGKLGQPDAPQQQKNNVSLYNSFVAVLLEIVENMLNSTDLILSYQQAAYKGNAQVLKNSAEMAATNFSMASKTLVQANQAAAQQMSAALFSTITSGLGLAQFMKSVATPRGLQQQFQEFAEPYKATPEVKAELDKHVFPTELGKKIAEREPITTDIETQTRTIQGHDAAAEKLRQGLETFFDTTVGSKDPKKTSEALKAFIEAHRKDSDVKTTTESLKKAEHSSKVSTTLDDCLVQIEIKDAGLKQQLKDAGFIAGPFSNTVPAVIDLKSMMKQDPNDANKVHCLVPNGTGQLEHVVLQKEANAAQGAAAKYAVVERTAIGDDPTKAELKFKSKTGSDLGLTDAQKKEKLGKMMRIAALSPDDGKHVDAVFGTGEVVSAKIPELQAQLATEQAKVAGLQGEVDAIKKQQEETQMKGRDELLARVGDSLGNEDDLGGMGWLDGSHIREAVKGLKEHKQSELENIIAATGIVGQSRNDNISRLKAEIQSLDESTASWEGTDPASQELKTKLAEKQAELDTARARVTTIDQEIQHRTSNGLDDWKPDGSSTFADYMNTHMEQAYKEHALAKAEREKFAKVHDLFAPAGFGQEEKLVQKIERMLHTATTEAATSTDRTNMFVNTVAPGFVGIASGQAQQASQQAMALSQQSGTQANAIMQQNDAQLKTLQQVVGDFLNTANTSLEKMIEMVISTVAMAARSFESH